MKRTVIALFPKYEDARNAADQLVRSGLNRDDVSLIPGKGERLSPGSAPEANVGAHVGGALGTFMGLGLDGDVAGDYMRGLSDGGTVLAVRAEPERAQVLEAEMKHFDGAKLHFVTASGESVPMYAPRSVTPPGTGDHQHATGDAQQPEDALDTRVKTDSGPEHWAPHNSEYQSSFDEFAGVMARDESTMLAGRGSEYERYRQAFDFGYHMASESRLAGRDWSAVDGELRTEWEKKRQGQWSEVRASVQQGWEANRGMG